MSKIKFQFQQVAGLHHVDTGWTDTIMICRKCGKKLKGGFGPDGDDSLRQALRGALRETGRRGEIGLIETGCLGVCPKRRVTITRASRPGEFTLVPAGFAVGELLGEGK